MANETEQTMEQKNTTAEAVEIKFDNIEIFKDFVKAVNEATDEAVLNITKSGISIKRMSLDGVSMVSGFIPNRMCSKYNLTEDKNIGVNIRLMYEYLKTEKNSVLTISIVNGILNMKTDYSSYTLPILLGLNDNPEKEPDLNNKVNAYLDAKELKQILKKHAKIGQYVRITTTQQYIEFASNGDSGEITTRIRREDKKLHKFSLEGRGQTTKYNTGILIKMLKATNKETMIKLGYATSEPIKVEYDMWYDSELVYYLAPYVE